MKRYEVFRKGNDPGRDIRRYGAAVDELTSRLPQGVPVEFKRRGDENWNRFATRGRLNTALKTKTLKVGEAFYTRRVSGRVFFVLRAIDVLAQAPSYPDSGGTSGIKSLWDVAWTAFRNLGPGYEFVYMGAFVCRRIDGSSSWSQHAFHKAFDFRIRKASASDSSIDDAATTKVANAVKAKTCEVLWHVPSHYYHAHVTDCPKATGTPACAR